MNRTGRPRLAVAALLAAAGMALGAVPGATAVAAEETGMYCVVPSASNDVTCFDTSAEAAAFEPDALTGAILYADRGYGGREYWINIVRPCSSSLTPTEKFVGTFGAFNNQASAVRTYNGCRIKLYDEIAYGPPSTPWLGTLSDLGLVSFSNEASSAKLS